MHGGLSPELSNLEQLKKIVRPTDVPEEGLLCDVLWSDPDSECNGWGNNDRGVSVVFNEKILEQFLLKNDLDLLTRAHQVVEDGYEFFGNRKLVTVFSAPNYCGEFDNSGAMMTVDENLVCSFQILKPMNNIVQNNNMGTANVGNTAQGGRLPRGVTPPKHQQRK